MSQDARQEFPAHYCHKHLGLMITLLLRAHDNLDLVAGAVELAGKLGD